MKPKRKYEKKEKCMEGEKMESLKRRHKKGGCLGIKSRDPISHDVFSGCSFPSKGCP